MGVAPLEAEARVVLRVPDHDDQRIVGLGSARRRLSPHQRRARAAALGRRQHRHGAQGKHRGTRVEPGAAERDVADHVLAVEGDQAEIGHMRLPAARRASTRSASGECSPNARRWTRRIAAKSCGVSGRTCNAGRRSPATLDSMAIEERIKADLSTAAKAQDRPRVSALRLLIDSLQKEAKQARRRARRAG